MYKCLYSLFHNLKLHPAPARWALAALAWVALVAIWGYQGDASRKSFKIRHLAVDRFVAQSSAVSLLLVAERRYLVA